MTIPTCKNCQYYNICWSLAYHESLNRDRLVEICIRKNRIMWDKKERIHDNDDTK